MDTSVSLALINIESSLVNVFKSISVIDNEPS